MATDVDRLVSEIRALPNEEKIRVLDALLTDMPDPGMDSIWAVEARRRWQAYKQGKLTSISYEEVMSQYKR